MYTIIFYERRYDRKIMKVMMLLSYYNPENCASITLINDLIKTLIQNNFEVVIYTPVPCRGVSDEVRQRYKKKKKEYFYDGKLKVIRYSLFKESRNVFFKASRYLIQNIIQIYKAINSDADVIFLNSTPPTMGIIGAIIKKCKKIPFIYNIQDLFPESLITSNICSNKNIIYKIGEKINEISCKNADDIIVISNNMKQNLVEKKFDRNKITVIPNWVNENEIVPIQKELNPFFEKFNIDRKNFNIIYAGNLGNSQDIDIILEAAYKTKDYKYIQYTIFGSGNKEEELKRKSSVLNLSNVKFFPLQSSKVLSELYGLADISIVSCKKGAGKSAMPSKTWSILSAGIPVLAIFDKNSALERLVVDYQIGFFCESGDIDGLVSCILDISKKKNLCSEYGKNARTIIEKSYTVEENTRKYIEIFEKYNSKERN